VQDILCKDGTNERIENLFSDCRVQDILCKDGTNERIENLFSDCRVQNILCKDTFFPFCFQMFYRKNDISSFSAILLYTKNWRPSHNVSRQLNR
jgi:hypothetical protein